jgi:hypothetical protein
MKNKSNPLKKNTIHENLAIFFFVLGAACFVIGLLLFLFKTTELNLGLPIDSNIFAAFGNLASGSVGVFWSFAGVILFYGALSLQREDLQRQREEFKRSIEIAEETKKNVEEQSDILRFQKFDNTFFNLLNQHNEITKAVFVEKATIGARILTGRECFVFLYTHFFEYATKFDARSSSEPNRNLDINKTLEIYENWWNQQEARLGLYFRNLYNLIKYVDRNESMAYDEKKVYTNIVRAQLSNHELLLLFYNCLSEHGRDKFKPLVERYHLLKTLPDNKLVNQKHYEEYDQSAFQ